MRSRSNRQGRQTLAPFGVLRLRVALIDRPDTAGRIYVVVGGKTPIEKAVDDYAGPAIPHWEETSP